MTNPELRALWLAYVLLLSSLIGCVSGVLAWIGGDHPANAIIAGTAGFAATTTLTLLVLTFATARPVLPSRRRGGRR